MSTRVTFHWNLRQVMAENGIFQTTDLIAPLAEHGIELSRQMIHRVVKKTPQRINLELLAALCDILNCATDDLLQLRREHVTDVPVAINDHGPGIGGLGPVRAIIRRPHQ